MSPNKEDGRLRQPDSELMKDITDRFDSFASFKDEFDNKAKTLFGSGKEICFVILIQE